MEGQPTPEKRGMPTWRLVVFGVVAIYAVLILLLNRGEVKIDFVFLSARISKVVLILLCLALGFAAGFLFDQLRRRRKST